MKLSIKDKDDEKPKKEAKQEIKKELPKKAALVLPEKEKSTKAKPWEAKASRKTEVVEEKIKEAPKNPRPDKLRIQMVGTQ